MRLNRFSLALLCATAFTGPALAQQLPTGASVVLPGSVAIQTNPGTMTITQNNNSAIVNWDTFSIGAGGVVNVVQPSAAAALLNRVTGNTPSTIAGQLTSNGQVFLVNPNGIAITSTGVVNTGAFAASTLGISDQNFLTKKYTFRGDGSSETVSNAGQINIVPGGYAALLGGRVDNSGSIIAPFGRIGLGAAEMVTMDIAGDSFLSVAIPSQVSGNDPLISNSGLISADGGYVQMTVAAAKNLTRNVINLTGTTEARSVSGVNGAIVLSGDGGAVTITGGTVNTSTRPGVQPPRPTTMIVPIPAPRPSYRGGDITITGGAIKLADATIDASGRNGGGDIKIGGDWHGNGLIPTSTNLDVDFLTSIKADALLNGNGGGVVLWSNGTTKFAGSISAQGAGANGVGGNIEVSGKQRLAYTGSSNTRAPSGKWGSVLLDPTNIVIYNPASSTEPAFLTYSRIDTDTIENDLQNNGTFIVNTNSAGADAGDIVFRDTLDWSSQSTPSTLRLIANRDIIVGLAPAGAIDGGTLGSIIMTAGRNIDISQQIFGANLTATAGGFLYLYSINVAGQTTLNAVGNITLGDFAGRSDAGISVTSSAGGIAVPGSASSTNGLQSNGNIALNAAVQVYLYGPVTAGGRFTVTAGNLIEVAEIMSAANGISMRAGTTFRLIGGFTPANIVAPTVYLQAGTVFTLDPTTFVRSTAGDLIVNAGTFVNNAGATALNTDGGRFLVYSNNWNNIVRGGLTGPNLYGRTYAANPPTSIPAGDIFVFRDRPTLTVSVGDLMRMYFARNPNQPTINITGLVNTAAADGGDTFDYATDGTTFATDTTPIYAPPGTYAGALQLLGLAASGVGYNLVVSPGDMTVTPAPNMPPPPFIFNNGNNAVGNPNGGPDIDLGTDNQDIVTAMVTEPDDISEVAAIEVTPGAAEISLQAVERVSQQFSEAIDQCERRLEEDGDNGAYLSCTGDALEAYADQLENPLIKLPPELKATVTVIRQTAQRVRAAAASPNKQAAVQEARAAVGELVNFVKQQTALVRAVDPETQALLQQQGQVMTQALQELDLQLVGAVEI